jgi:DNA-binding MarR family transcriptional regulator
MQSEKRAVHRGLREDLQYPWRSRNTGRLLLGALIIWQDALVQGLQDVGFKNFRSTHMNLLRHIDAGGTRITEIAERSGFTKQSIGKLIVACEKENLVATIPDPTDGRAKIVMFTKLGRSVIVAERSILEKIDTQLEAILGPEQFKVFRANLEQVAEGLSAPRKTRSRSTKQG